MFGIDRMSPVAVAAGLVVLAALVGCGGKPSVASRSAAAFQEANAAGGHTGQHGAQDAHGAESRPEVPSPGQPASTLRPDPIDAPAATSVADAQRSADLAAGMAGGHGGHGDHGGHGTGSYRHVDAGRGPDAHQAADEPRDSGADVHQHHHSSEPVDGEEGEGAPAPETAAYVCPMHPEVTSETPGTCSKCGMALVPRREE